MGTPNTFAPCVVKMQHVGIGRIKSSEGYLICFVENVIIGQVIIGKIKKIKSNHIVCSLIEVKVKSELEITNEFDDIPGAPFINLDIKTQVNEIKKVKKHKLLVGAAVGAGINEFERAKNVLKENNLIENTYLIFTKNMTPS